MECAIALHMDMAMAMAPSHDSGGVGNADPRSKNEADAAARAYRAIGKAQRLPYLPLP